MNRFKPGFTLIEVIIAMAIATVMVVAVQSATQAMTRTARIQAENSAEEVRFQRCVEILRRDLQGWIVIRGAVEPVNPTQAEKDGSILHFATTADSLVMTTSLTAVSLSSPRCVTNLRYMLRKSETEFSIARVESGPGNGDSEIVVWKGSVEPRFEFLQANVWIPEWKSKERPKGLRLINGAKYVFFVL